MRNGDVCVRHEAIASTSAMYANGFPFLCEDRETCEGANNNGLERCRDDATVRSSTETQESRELHCRLGRSFLRIAWPNLPDEDADLSVVDALHTPDVHPQFDGVEPEKRAFP